MAVTTRLTWNEEKSLQKLLGNVSLSLLYQSSVHGYSVKDMLARCSCQGSTITVIYYEDKIFGAFLLEHYPKTDQDIRKKYSSFFFSLQNNKTTAFLNTSLKITDEALAFQSSNHEKWFTLVPEKHNVKILYSLRTELGMKGYCAISYRECEVFRVEGLLNYIILHFHSCLCV